MKIVSYIIFLASITAALFIGSYYYYLLPIHNRCLSALAIVHPTKGNTITGKVQFTKEKNGVRVIAHLEGLTSGKHGFHIHTYGDCSGENGTCAGDHFNPTNGPHGAPGDKHVHSGDLGNVIADQTGKAVYDEINYNIDLFGPHSILGRSVIIHEDEDDLHSQPTGNSGNRIGCGVIGISKKHS